MPRLKREIEPSAVRAFRERRGWTLEQMADEVWVSPAEVAAWEAGTIRVPAGSARRIRDIAARSRRRADELVAGPQRLPRCAWADANAPGLHEILFYKPHEAGSNLPVQQHLETCEECQRVERFGRFARSLPTVPERAVEDPAGELGYGLDSLPTLAVIALLSLAGFSLVLLGRGLFALLPGDPAFPEITDVWVEAVVFFWVSDRARAFTNDLMEGRRPYARGLLSHVAGMVAALLTWKLRTPDADLGDPTVLAVCAAVAVVAGLLMGWMQDVGGGNAVSEADAPGVAASAPVPRLGEGAAPSALDGAAARRHVEHVTEE